MTTSTPFQNLASELIGLITSKGTATFRHASQKIKNSFSRMLPPHIITALVTKENWHHPLTMTHSLNTGVNTQEIRPSGKMQRLLLQVNWFLYLPSHSP